MKEFYKGFYYFEMISFFSGTNNPKVFGVNVYLPDIRKPIAQFKNVRAFKAWARTTSPSVVRTNLK